MPPKKDFRSSDVKARLELHFSQIFQVVINTKCTQEFMVTCIDNVPIQGH